MNDIMGKIDIYLLELFGRVSRMIYRWVGITNFHLAKFFLCVTLFSVLSNAWSDFCFKKAVILPTINILVSFFVTYKLWDVITYRQRTCVPGIKNPGQIRFGESFVRVIVITQVFIRAVFLPRDFLVCKTPYDYIALNLINTMYVTLLIILYLMALDPEPPSESKLRKGLNKLRDTFVSEALPAPV
jgi:cytochrome c oxidase subunit IV